MKIQSSELRWVTILFLLHSFLWASRVETVLAAEQGPYEVVIERGIKAEMRDGVQLTADIYRPKADGQFPVILQRTPYDRDGGRQSGPVLASHGYVVVFQDTRGRYDSGGEFYPFLYESNDGYDTVEWVAALAYSNGRVGMFGGSYVGATQMLAAMAAPPHLQAIFPYVTASEYYDGWTYQNGALMQWFTSSWTSSLAADTLRRKVSERARFTDWTWQLPVEDYKLMNLPNPDELAPYFDDWVEHETEDEFWKRWKISDYYSEMSVKGLHGMGWHDIFLKGSIKNFTGLRSSAKTPEARAGQRMLMGPWAHAATSAEGKIGDVVFGEQAVVDMDQVALEWFDYALKDSQNDYATGAPIRLFVMGENLWRNENEWPLDRTEYTQYYLHSTNGANSIRGDGVLSVEAPEGEEPDRYSYDPANPVWTLGGRLCCGDAVPPGPFDQRPNEGRTDVLIYSTPPLEREIEVTGHVTVDLYASSTARDTDFTAMLIDVDPSGYARFITDGITRARFRSDTTNAEFIEPGKIYKYTIDLWATSNLFKRGHRIRLYISSSNFPRFNRNLNTGEQTFNSSGMVTAQQTIFHEGDRPSVVTLPIIPR